MLVCADPNKPLTKLEKEVIDFMNYRAPDIREVTITDIAEQAFVSTATVSRAVRKCGFSSFSAACYHLAQERQKNQHKLYLNDILAKCQEECVRTIEGIDIKQIEKVVEYINGAKRIILLARGLTRLLAEEFCFQLQCLKYNVTTLTDGNIMKIMERYAQPDDLLIIISVRNSTPELFIAAECVKKMGCKVVSLCCESGTTLESVSDIMVRGYSFPITPNQMFGGTSRVSLMLITRIISEYLSMRQQG